MPVFSSHLVDYKGLGVGDRLREIRQSKNETLRTVAARAGISEAKLSNLETGKLSLDLAELGRLAAALDVSLQVLFPTERLYHFYVSRGEALTHIPPITRELIGSGDGRSTHHNRVWALAEPFVGKRLEPLKVQIMPLADKELHFIQHDHEEFMFVLQGQVETAIKVGADIAVERLSPGDCIYFRSSLPHCHRSLGDEPAQTLNVIYSLRGSIDPSEDELNGSGHRYYRRGVYEDACREAAEKIGLLRTARGLTLADLARQVGIGVRLLADIESGKRPPDIALLLRLARQFRRPVEYFVSTTLEGEPGYFVQRGSELERVPIHYRKPEADREHASIFRPLAIGFPDRGLHPYYVRMRVNSDDTMAPHDHLGQEFIYVLAGEVELVTHGHEAEPHAQVLRPGDSVFLESSVPHRLRGQSKNPYAETSAEMIIVFWHPLGADHLFYK
jgi:transcriptional regulator with XRE-family HTH domain